MAIIKGTGNIQGEKINFYLWSICSELRTEEKETETRLLRIIIKWDMRVNYVHFAVFKFIA